jgi:hypothetical protein
MPLEMKTAREASFVPQNLVFQDVAEDNHGSDPSLVHS